jgi:hypothetical protein
MRECAYGTSAEEAEDPRQARLVFQESQSRAQARDGTRQALAKRKGRLPPALRALDPHALATLLAADPTRGLAAPASRRGGARLAGAGAPRRRLPALARGRLGGLATRRSPFCGGLAGRALSRGRPACCGSSTRLGLGLRGHPHPGRHAHLARSLFLGPHRPLVRHLPEPPRLSLRARVILAPAACIGDTVFDLDVQVRTCCIQPVR